MRWCSFFLRWTLLWCAWACSASPSSNTGAPQVTPAGSVGPALDSAQQPLAVAFAGPRGAARLDSTINILFSKALPPEHAAQRSATLGLSPRVQGSWHWIGSRAVTFVPSAGRLPAATAFTVSIPAGVLALDGDTLAHPYEFKFETPAPAVIESQPQPGEQGQKPDVEIRLTFNQKVSPGALERAARLSAVREGKSTSLPFTARARAGKPHEFIIAPRAPLPLASSIELSIAAGLTGGEGPLPMAEPYALSFETYGPLRVLAARCHLQPESNRCDPEGSIWIELSNPVQLADFRKHLSLEPPLELSWSEDVAEESRHVYLPVRGALAPATSYRVAVSAGLRDQHGQQLDKRQERSLSTGNFSPRVSLPISGEIFAAPLDELTLRARNAGEVRVFTRRLSGAQLLDYFRVWGDYEQRRSLPDRLQATSTRLSSDVDNQFHYHPIALAPILGGPGARGAAWLGWRHAGGNDGQLVQVTDLALTAKLSQHGSLVWITRLSDGSAVPGATLELLGREPKLSKRYQSDAQGLVSIPASDYRPRLEEYESKDDTLLIVSHGSDSSFRRVADFLRPWRLDVPVRLAVPEREYALLFSERGVYRPGDVIQVKGILRREAAGGNRALAGRKLELRLRDPFDEVALRRNVETTRFGTFAADVALPHSGALGNWRIEAEGFTDDALMVDVAEYRPVEFKVQVEPLRPSYLRKESARFTTRAEYLFGSPMAGAKLSYAATREQSSFAPPDSAGYVTSEDVYRAELPNAPLDSAVLARGEAQLSAAGSFELDLPLTLPGQIGPEHVRLDSEVSDLSRQAVAASAGVVVHPAAHYIGIGELESWFVNLPSRIEPRIVALSPSGQRLAGRKVKLELVRRRWTVAREQTSDGWRTLSSAIDETRGACEVVTRSEPVSCALQPSEAGQWFIRAASSDEQGRSTRAALGFYAIGSSGGVSWADNDQRKLPLVLDKQQYRVGDKARVLIKSPFARAEALLTVERAGIYEHRRLELEGPAPTVEIAIDERMRPNAYVAVHLVQGVVANAPPTPPEVTPEPGYRFGYATLIVDPEARRLNVGFSGLQSDYRPGQKVSLDLRVTRAGGAPHPAELTVYAVDEGVLSLIGYQAPDPVRRFTEPRPLSVATLETRDALGRRLLLGPESDKGADGGGGAQGGRSDFRTTAFFDPHVVTDAEGKAHVEFNLPDTLTSYRVMAVAVSEDDRYGLGQTTLTVNQPLMLQPALPRSLRAGDRFRASTILTSRGLEPGAVKVQAAVAGALLHGPAEREVVLGKDASLEVQFDVEATAPGEARFQFTASSAQARDQVELKRRVASPAVIETVAVYGQTDAREAQALAALSELRPDVGGLDVTLAPTALVGLDVSLHQLARYPHECTEQLASRVLPLGPLAALAQRYGLPVPANAQSELERNVGELLRRQQSDGSFRLWPDSLESHAWTTGYALWVLWQAKQAGARVPERVFEQSAGYLRRFLGGAVDDPETLATRALFVDVLAAIGKPDREYENQLFERRKDLPLFGRALLLHAAASGPGDDGNIGVLSQELEASVTLRGNKAQLSTEEHGGFERLFHSPARTHALMLWALLAANPKHPFGPALARGLLDRRKLGTWRSTQETAYALLALDAYRRAGEPELPHFDATVWLGDRKLGSGTFHGPEAAPLQQRVAMPELLGGVGRLVFEKQGQGTLFYEARLTYAPRALPGELLERGFSLRKSTRVVRPEDLERLLSEPPASSELIPAIKGGDLLLIDLIVAAPTERFFAVIEDPLPAGLEAIDSHLQTTSPQLDVRARAPSGDDGFQRGWFRQELRDDRVVFYVDHMPAGMHHYRYLARATALGRFVVPPTRVSEMYQPEVFGRTAAGSVEVQ